MHIFHFLHGLLIPVLAGHVRVFLLGGHRFRRHKASVVVIYGNTSEFFFVCLVQEIHSALNILLILLKIIFLYHVVINRIGNLPHAHQIFFQVLPSLLHQLLCTVYGFRPGRIGKPQIQNHSQNQHNGNRHHGRSQHNGGLNFLWLHFFQLSEILIFHFLCTPFCTWKAILRTAV